METIKFGLNMGAIQADFEKKPVEVLRELSQIGYKGIEISYPLPLPVDEFNSLCKELDMEVISLHASRPDNDDELSKLTDFAQSVHCCRIVFGGFYLWELNSADDYQKQAEVFDKLGEKCKKNGIQVFYHNHYWELDKFNGKYGMDILAEATNPEWVSFELDVCWLTVGCADPAEYIRKQENRCRLIHFKDVVITDSGKRYEFALAGKGVVDFRRIRETVNPRIVEWIISEQDNSTFTPMESARINYENYKRLGVV